MQDIQGFMLINLYAFILIVAVAIIFFKKKRLKRMEDETYAKFVVTNVFLSCSGLILGMLVIPSLKVNSILIYIFNSLYLISTFLWVYYLTFYTYFISSKHKKNINRITNIFKFVNYFCIILILLLPRSVEVTQNGSTAQGPAVIFTYFTYVVGIIIQITCIILEHNFKNKKYIPMYLLIFLGSVIFVILSIKPTLNYIINPTLIFICYIMYHTIENPDVKMINELNINKDILEKNNEDRSNFMFRMTQEVRKPISNIDSLTNMIDIKNKYVTLEDIVNAIKSNTRHISYVVNNVLDVSNIDIRKIKLVNTTYNVQRLFEEINILMQEKISPDITYRANISNEIPDLLYGDYIKLKQIIMSILMNSVENTKKGFIELNINVLIKYDMCRLIISVEDSGKGMDIRQVNKILTIDKPLDEEDDKKLNSLDVDLNITKKIINLVGGSMTIKSEVNKGTEFIVVIDQKIVENKESIKEYENFDGNKVKRVLLVDDNIDKLQEEKNILEKYNVDVVSTMYGMDAIDRTRTGEIFDLIIIDDDMTKLSGVATYQELSKLDNFNTPVVIMLEKNKEIIKNHYLDKGFIDYLLKDNLEEEINRIVNKHLK